MTYSYTDLLAYLGIGAAHPGGLQLTRAILEEISINEDTVFLEVGCGTGQTTSYIISTYPCKLYAIDLHPVMVEKANKRLSQISQQVSILEGTVEKMPYSDFMFDYVLSESVTSFTNLPKSLSEYYRVLNKEGTLILIEMVKLQELNESEENEVLLFYGLKQLLMEVHWIELLKEVGFDEVQSLEISLENLIYLEEDFSEFDMSENMDPKLFELLDQHEELNQKYKDKLGFRIFLCKKL